jgi:ankyrin repeat protein
MYFFQYACLNNHPNIITELVKKGANMHLRHFESQNVPLHEAATLGHLECVKVSGHQMISVYTQV